MRGMLTRGQTADRLGVSVARVRQLQDQRKLRSQVDRRGWHMFEEADVELLRLRRARARGEDPPAGRVTTAHGRRSCTGCGRETRLLYDPTTGASAEAGVCFSCGAALRRAERRAQNEEWLQELRGRIR